MCFLSFFLRTTLALTTNQVHRKRNLFRQKNFSEIHVIVLTPRFFPQSRASVVKGRFLVKFFRRGGVGVLKSRNLTVFYVAGGTRADDARCACGSRRGAAPAAAREGGGPWAGGARPRPVAAVSGGEETLSLTLTRDGSPLIRQKHPTLSLSLPPRSPQSTQKKPPTHKTRAAPTSPPTHESTQPLSAESSEQ